MTRRTKMTKTLAVALAMTFVVSCASTTTIRTLPQGAKLYIDGEFVGTTPHTHTDTAPVGSTKHVRLEKKGCSTFTTTFSRSEEFSVGACIGGFFVLVPFLWIMGYKPERTYEMVCEDETAAPSQAPQVETDATSVAE